MGHRNHWLVWGIMALAGCSKGKSPFIGRERHSAPQSSKDVGVLIEAASEGQVTALLKSHPQAQVRVLSPVHGLYEIFGVNFAVIKAEFQGASEPNHFFTWSKSRPLEISSMRPPTGLKLGDLNTCRNGAMAPEAAIATESPLANLDGATIELGQSVRVNGNKSQRSAPANARSNLKMAFVINFPESSGLPQLVQTRADLEFKPASLGLYTIFLVVQDITDNCSLDAIRFIVTANRPFLKLLPTDLKLDLSRFTHLAGLSAPEAWTLSEGEGITIAIVDTGVNYNHPSLSPNISLNDKEIPANGVDDDGNGFIDDYLGYDFVNQDPFPYDDDSHGTHVAGLAAARQFGLARHAKILPVKALNSQGGDAGSIAASIRYAVDRGANIINLSLGVESPTPHPSLVRAIEYAEQKGILVVAAAGNGDAQTGLGFNIDENPVFPASLKNDNILSVAASDSINVLAPYSNFGGKSVHVVAPGGLMNADPIISCAFENPAGTLFVGMTGTSMAAPIAAGIAAQVWGQHPTFTFMEIKSALIAAGPTAPELKNITVSGRKLNSLRALKQSDTKGLMF